MLSKTLILSTLASAAMAQSSALNIVNTAGPYNGQTLSGYHIGAALNYMVVSTGSGDAFLLNTTSSQLLDSSVVTGYNLPCYIVDSAQISTNAGPLQCGAGDSGTLDHASATGSALSIEGVADWYVCTVNSFTYGYVSNVIVGAFSAGVAPTGAGIQGNCTAIDSLQLGGTVASVNATASATTTTAPPYPTYAAANGTNATVVTVTTKMCPVCEETVITTVMNCSTSMTATATPGVPATTPATSMATTVVPGNVSATASPSASSTPEVWTGGAAKVGAWGVLGGVAVVFALFA